MRRRGSFRRSLQGWLPEGHLVRFVVDIVEQLDLSDLTTDYSRGGKRAYHPGLLLSLLFYGYATGVFSSRKLERATYESVAFRFIASNLHPDHDTIAAFRKRFIGCLGGLFMSSSRGALLRTRPSENGTCEFPRIPLKPLASPLSRGPELHLPIGFCVDFV